MRLNTNSLKRTVAVFAAVCTLGACCVAGTAAWAQNDGANTANIDTNENGKTSITIHKYENNPAGTTRGNGEKVADLQGRKPIKGVKFTLWRVKQKAADGGAAKEIDLTKPEDWLKIKDLEKLSDVSAGDKHTASEFISGSNKKFEVDETTKQEKTTSDQGEAKFENLQMGLYYIEETDVNGATVENQKVSITKRVAPFFVTTPLPKESDNSWIYNVNVYPKNDTSNELPTKTASKPSTNDLTDNTTITWTISIPLSAPKNGGKYEKIGFKDKLETGLTYDSIESANLVTYKDNGQKDTTVTDVKLDLNTHYTETHNDGLVYFKLTDTETTGGLAKAYAEYSKHLTDKKIVKLEVKLKTKVAKDVKDITNVANTFVDDSTTGKGDDNNPCTSTDQRPECQTNKTKDTAHFGTLTVKKFSDGQGANKKPLNNAKFDVYEVTADNKNVDDIKSAEKKDNGIFTLKGDGNTEIASTKINSTLETKTSGNSHGSDSVRLFVYNSNETNKAVTTKLYCLVETEAPAGYLLNSTPQCVALKADTADQADTNNTKEITNAKATGLDQIIGALPMTGARGLVLLTACGIVGLGGTMFYIITRRRKEQEEA
ncbi:SpaH/EbpB family LPXTG-anchored major pilin [Gardnerella vaginalis]|uniref:LPXTG-motif protein cell wall anchor domain protein n=1 Tax=Gardnerella vaginalis TaxID=2702 RepID=A0A133NRQ0_GARVA|nr:SpaH/EbpB family LPXTG-anchored major pilin [Gardnerella vaginalis]KXA18983.1 LPXTG-motif protein cell wall anchor domain protein [Gardnerella vaginalis]MDK7192340.1 SpaH/EbpB family LPXTG-anchored major pilin [Bifidobacterium sp. UMB1197]